MKNVSNNVRTTTTNVLGHAGASVFHLGTGGYTAQLLNHFNNLVHASRTDRMTARFQTAASCYRNAPGR